MSSTPTKPACLKDEHLEYLDELRDSGETNMFGARPYLVRDFPDDFEDDHDGRNLAGDVLQYWMKTFAERHGI